ncbi:ferredoxin reductase family protein [Jiangella alkaliphila]|uniref:Predicted ferric reductase n=1 Tax=Jiangella alkaliphila TaxID=419479 RepID=A0A1H2LBN8_9ACTN|nr:ferredoxin reductase family protein [Jiangella alkaliphila]SDU78224.1 Predicted ferric reductase [Jiangella alkaliphila]
MAETVLFPPPVRRRRLRPRKPPAVRWADLLVLLVVASLVVPCWMWVRNGGVVQLAYPQYLASSIGLITGLVSSDLMVVQVLLMARIPWVERAWGHDVLTHRHRTVGYWSFWLMMAHVLAFAIERTQRTTDPLGALWAVFVTDPWMLWASIGTIMLIAVVVTSIRLARVRLRYESWHLIHLYAYLGMTFGLPHQILDGTHFHGFWTQVYWWGIYGVALAAVLVWRVGLPAWRSAYHGLRVTGVRAETPGVYTVTMAGRRLDLLRARSGQFFVWRFRDGPGWTRGNPYTISDAPRPERLRVTIQAVGDGSARVAALEPGTRALIEGPYGTMTAERRRNPRMLLIAAGVGITPMRGLLEDTPFEPGEATLLFRYSAEQHAIFRAELDDLAARRGVRLLHLPGPRRTSGSWLPDGLGDGTDAELLRRLVPDLTVSDIYVCGPPGWIRAVRKSAVAAGARQHQIHSEDFAW